MRGLKRCFEHKSKLKADQNQLILENRNLVEPIAANYRGRPPSSKTIGAPTAAKFFGLSDHTNSTCDENRRFADLLSYEHGEINEPNGRKTNPRDDLHAN